MLRSTKKLLYNPGVTAYLKQIVLNTSRNPGVSLLVQRSLGVAEQHVDFLYCSLRIYDKSPSGLVLVNPSLAQSSQVCVVLGSQLPPKEKLDGGLLAHDNAGRRK